MIMIIDMHCTQIISYIYLIIEIDKTNKLNFSDLIPIDNSTFRKRRFADTVLEEKPVSVYRFQLFELHIYV